MDIGRIIIAVHDGVPRIVRCEAAPDGGTRLVAAPNSDDLAGVLRTNLALLGADLTDDVYYPCPVQLQDEAQFAPPALPPDAISLAAARHILFPGVSDRVAWGRVYRAIAAGRLQAYTSGPASSAKRYVSRAEALALATTPPDEPRGPRIKTP